ncbi:MAG: hypothetical protein U0234_11640 [Sandaracinus sp.]
MRRALQGAARFAVLLAAMLVGSCTALTHFDDLAFDDDPCPPPPPGGCTGGSTLVLVGRSLLLNRADAEGRRDGFDLDATSEAICGEPDLVAPDGSPGIDTNLSPIFEAYEDLTNVDLEAMSRERSLRGESLGLVILEHVDAGTDDDCIAVTQRTGVFPVGALPTDMDADGDGLLDPGLTFDYLPSTGRSTSACVIDGVIHARFPSQETLVPGTTIEARTNGPRLRMPLPVDGAPTRMLLGGSISIDDLTGAFPAAVIDYLRQHADVHPSSRSADDCSEISFALFVETVPAVLGSLRTP